MCREKPDVVRDREHERNLQRIATRWNIIQSPFTNTIVIRQAIYNLGLVSVFQFNVVHSFFVWCL